MGGKMSMKRAWAAFLVTVAAVLPIRIYSVFTWIDPTTGFYKDNGKMAVTGAAVAILGAAVTAFLGRRKDQPQLKESVQSVSAAVFAALAGVFLAGQSIVSLGNGFSPMNMLLAIFGVGAAVALLMAAYDFGCGSMVLRRHPLAALLLPVWGCFRLISLFITYVATVNRFENIYHTFTAVLLLLFLFAQTKLLAGVDAARGAKRVFLYGFPAVIAALTDSIPNIALLFAGRSTLGGISAGFYFVDLLLAVYGIAYLSAEGKRRTSVPMVEITPDFSEDDTLAQNRESAEETDKQNAEKTSEEREYLDFLQKVYHGEHKIVEKREPIPDASTVIKS
jgi:hypothetical protein